MCSQGPKRDKIRVNGALVIRQKGITWSEQWIGLGYYGLPDIYLSYHWTFYMEAKTVHSIFLNFKKSLDTPNGYQIDHQKYYLSIFCSSC